MVVGRGTEQDYVRGLLQAARQAAPGTVVLTGEPGIGKTALLQDTAAVAAELGFGVVAVAGIPAERAIPGAMLSLLGARLAEAGASPEDTAALVAATSGALPATAYADLIGAISAAADCAPLLLLGDDLQWWDPASTGVLAFALRRLRHDPVAVVLAARADWAVPDALAKLPRLDLGPVPRHDAPALARTVAADVTADVAHRIWDAAGGNSLGVVETARNLPVDVRVGRVPVGDVLPVGSGVVERWAARVVDLPEPSQRAVTMLAVDMSPDGMPFAAALSSAGLAAADLEPAEAAGLVVAAGRWTFPHPLVRHGVLAAVAPRIVRAAHGALAEALGATDRTGLGRARRAWHLAASTIAPDPSTAAALAEEAEALAAGGGMLPAAEVFALAAGLEPDPGRAADWLARAARLAIDGYDEPAAVRWAEAGLERHPDGATRGHLLLAKGVALARVSDVVSGAEALRESLAYLQGEDRLDAVRGLLFAVDLMPRRLETAAPLIEELAAATPLRQADRLLIGHLLWAAGNERGLSILRQAFADLDVDAAVRTGVDTECVFNAAIDVGLDVSGPMLRRCNERLLSYGDVVRRSDGLMSRAFVRYFDGDWGTVDSSLDELAELSEATGLPDLYGGCLRMIIQSRRGQAAPFEISYAQAAATTSAAGMWLWNACLPGERGVLALTRGDPEGAQGLFGEALGALDWARFPPNSVLADFAVLRVEALLDLGRRAEARRARQVLVERLGPGTTMGRGFLARAAAGLADDETADALFRAAEEDIERGVHAFMLATTRLRHARWLRRHRRRSEAAELLQSALAMFEPLRCEPWAQQCRDELHAVGVDVTRCERYDASATLTAQERRVAEAVAEGITNKEVARRLFLSPRTVEIHLTHVYRKLGVPGRAALIRELATAPT